MDVLNEILTSNMIAELEREDDENVALRKALLHALLLLDDAPSADAFREHVLLCMPALARHFEGHKHPYIGEVDLLRARDAEDRVTLMLPADRTKRLVDAALARLPD